ncbi:MAG: zinc-binding dehydrogenase [Candidatus Methylacidiphilales bacterium]|nr:zinc-binding dehydrogenase [Candidatus Methylacidiphilales bacterium]
MKTVVCTAREFAELLNQPNCDKPLPPDEVRGRSLVTLISPGTEVHYNYLATRTGEFPSYPGYASVFQITETGSEVIGFKTGDIVLSSGRHSDFQQARANDILLVPAGLKPEAAAFARLMGVSMSTLNTAAAHAPARVLVTGLGPVGNLAAQVFARCGYRVTAVDPVESRRDTAIRCGLNDVRSSMFAAPEDLEGNVALHVECSGHEQAVLDGCRCVCKRGEISLIGVPWTRKTDISSFELLTAVFHKYVVLRSGWEWEIPRHRQDFRLNSIQGNYEAALEWLSEGSINVEPLIGLHNPEQCQNVYQGLLQQTLPTPAALFDWRLLS